MRRILFLLPVLSTLLCPLAARAQSIIVVQTCGALPSTPALGSANGPIAVDRNGNICASANVVIPPITVNVATPLAVNIPTAAQVVSGAFSDGALTSEGSQADAAYTGSGGSTIIAALKGIYAAIKSISVTATVPTPLAVTFATPVAVTVTPAIQVTANVPTPLAVTVTNTPIQVTQSTSPWIVSGTVLQGTSPWVVSGNALVTQSTTPWQVAFSSVPVHSVNQGTSPWIVSGTTLQGTSPWIVTGNALVTQSTTPWQVAFNSPTVNQGTSPWVVTGTVLQGSPPWTVTVTPAIQVTANVPTPLAVAITGTPVAVTVTPAIQVTANVPTPLAVTVTNTPIQVTQSTSPWIVSGTMLQGTSPWVVTGNALVTQSTTPWQVSFNQPTVNQGTSPWTVGGTVGATQSTSPWTVNGTVGATQSTSPWTVNGTVGATQGTSPWVVTGTMLQGTTPWVVTGNALVTQSTSPWQVSFNQPTVNQGTSPWVVTGNALVTQSTTPWQVNFNSPTVNQGTTPWTVTETTVTVTPNTLSAWSQGLIGQAPPNNGVTIAVVASATEAPTQSSNTLIEVFSDLVGKIITSPYANRENYISGSVSTSGVTVAALIATPAIAAQKYYITDFNCTRNDAGTTAIVVSTNDVDTAGVQGAKGWTVPNSGGGGGFMKTFNVPLKTAAGTAFQIKNLVGSGVTSLMCTATGYVGY